MTKRTVSPLQIKALEKLASRSGGSAYALGCSLGTLNSLALKGYARADRSRLGSLFSPRTGIGWFITDDGLAIVRSNGECTKP